MTVSTHMIVAWTAGLRDGCGRFPVLVTTNTVFLPFQVCWEEDCEQQVSLSGIRPNMQEVFRRTAGL